MFEIFFHHFTEIRNCFKIKFFFPVFKLSLVSSIPFRVAPFSASLRRLRFPFSSSGAKT